MRFFLPLRCLLLALFVVGPIGIHGAVAAPEDAISSADAPYSLEIAFSKKLRKHMKTIDRVERIREERFRRSLTDESSSSVSVLGRPGVEATFRDVRWAGEYLVPELQDYGVESLLRAMVAHGVAEIMPDFDGSIDLKLNRIKVDNHSVALLRASGSYITGKVEVRDSNGKKIVEDKLTVNLLINKTVDANYQGPDYAFAETDESDRVGPVLAAFVQAALGKAWPDRKKAIPGVVIVRMTGPNVSIRD